MVGVWGFGGGGGMQEPNKMAEVRNAEDDEGSKRSKDSQDQPYPPREHRQ